MIFIRYAVSILFDIFALLLGFYVLEHAQTHAEKMVVPLLGMCYAAIRLTDLGGRLMSSARSIHFDAEMLSLRRMIYELSDRAGDEPQVNPAFDDKAAAHNSVRRLISMGFLGFFELVCIFALVTGL